MLIQQEDEKELFEHHRFIADKGQGPVRIDKFLVDKIEHVSRTKIKEATVAGYIKVNDISVKANYKIKAGDVVSVLMERPPREIELKAEKIPLDIVYEDEQVLVINKPMGMVVHPGHGNYTGTLVNALMYYLSDLPLFNSDNPRPGLVHRLDKDTTGLMVIAKTEAAASDLAIQFFNRTTQRRYVALVWGNFDEDEGTIKGNIGRSQKDRKVMCVYPNGDEGKHAITHYSVIERFGYVTLVECRLETGRTHQIRAHMKHIKHPLFNDATYGGNQILKGTTFSKYKQFINNCFCLLPRQALHARSLGFRQPTTGEELYFESELPKDMKAVIEKWRTYTNFRNI